MQFPDERLYNLWDGGDPIPVPKMVQYFLSIDTRTETQCDPDHDDYVQGREFVEFIADYYNAHKGDGNYPRTTRADGEEGVATSFSELTYELQVAWFAYFINEDGIGFHDQAEICEITGFDPGD
ncbi:MAG: hypothetical protein ACTSU9_03765 [Promethearchaeota archaeon]